ncbi:hypothetical protein AV274_0613 [Blastocystis sp. ATCC 50177/Nand II]|uniref:Uncharacterized protein n=1 Tax=Blastocystis sp. subtype 1 (strain ATCC 50177 / NandII) TaxID=478820 RepID=A0A196SKT8_BLAHN|nr:hypothetical protein AV274_0613 [Blastocystis sp. ATCC 50177/Nand II]
MRPFNLCRKGVEVQHKGRSATQREAQKLLLTLLQKSPAHSFESFAIVFDLMLLAVARKDAAAFAALRQVVVRELDATPIAFCQALHKERQRVLLFTRFLQCVRQSSPAVQTFFQDVIEKASFLLESQTDDARVCKEENRLLSQTRWHSLLDTCTREDVHAYNVCVALLKRRQILRCCVLWVKYWGIDVVLVGSERWVEERKEVHRKAMAKCSEMTKRFLLFDACMMDCWKCLLGKSRVMAEVLAMESSSVLYPM